MEDAEQQDDRSPGMEPIKRDTYILALMMILRSQFNRLIVDVLLEENLNKSDTISIQQTRGGNFNDNDSLFGSSHALLHSSDNSSKGF